MHLLQRRAAAPACLAKYHHGRDNWSMQSPTGLERGAIWAELDAMQGRRCAYCEAAISEGRRHIEHFRQRGRYPQGTFDWHNLFGSCDRESTCGAHKDWCGPYDHQVLIKPDQEDPDEFLVFDPQGGIHPKAGLAPDKHHRAQETIRILNLTGGGLPQMRRAAASGYLYLIEHWAELAEGFPEKEWRPLVEDERAQELARTAHLPFATAIRHTLTSAGA